MMNCLSNYRQKTEMTPNPTIASPPATKDNIPRPPPIPAIAIPQTIVSASPTRLWFFIFEMGLYNIWNIINVKLEHASLFAVTLRTIPYTREALRFPHRRHFLSKSIFKKMSLILNNQLIVIDHAV